MTVLTLKLPRKNGISGFEICMFGCRMLCFLVYDRSLMFDRMLAIWDGNFHWIKHSHGKEPNHEKCSSLACPVAESLLRDYIDFACKATF